MPPKRKIKKSEKPSKRHTCKLCNNVFKTLEQLRTHGKQCKHYLVTAAVTKKINKYSCNECSKKFRFQARFEAHLKNEHSKLRNSIQCQKCPVRCPNKSVMDKHIADFHERETFYCPYCSKEFARNSHVLRHMAQKGCGGNEAKIYPCEICNVEFTRKDNLMVHLRLQHISSKQYECKKCSYSSMSFSKLIVHTRNVHEDKPRFECDHCGKVQSSRASMTKHLEIHGTKKYACEVCMSTSYTIEVMRRHVLTHVIDKPYKCDQCPVSFIQRSQLRRHLEKHQQSTCDVCGRMFASQKRLLKHMSQHPQDEVNKETEVFCTQEGCAVANTPFKSLRELNKHIQQEHVEHRPFKCGVCHKYFPSEAYLRRHVLSHTLERPRRCMYCVAARAYVHGMQLVRHVRKAHPAVFKDHLAHVRSVLNNHSKTVRVKQSEMESILNVMDAEAERILEGYGEGVLYGGMQETPEQEPQQQMVFKSESKPLMCEEDLVQSLNQLLSKLIYKDTLECFGWPDETVDIVLEKVVEHCGGRAADRSRWTRVQCLRENAKHLFLYVVEDKNITRMLQTHTIDQVIKDVLNKVNDGDEI